MLLHPVGGNDAGCALPADLQAANAQLLDATRVRDVLTKPFCSDLRQGGSTTSQISA
jgi:hypothetical protein